MEQKIDVFEFQIPKKYSSIMFFSNKDIMEKCCKNWKGLFPIVGNGADPEAEENLPGVFAAHREITDKPS